jgi:hypothetical protein
MGVPKGNDGESRHGIAPSRATGQDFRGNSHFTKPFNPASGLKCSAWAKAFWIRATAIKPDTGYSAQLARKSINAKSLALGLLF